MPASQTSHDVFLVTKAGHFEPMRLVTSSRVAEVTSLGVPSAESVVRSSTVALVDHRFKEQAGKLLCPTLEFERPPENWLPDAEDPVFTSLVNVLRSLSSLLGKAVESKAASGLRVWAETSELFSFRVGSFVRALWSGSGKDSSLHSYGGTEVMPLYPPTVRDSSRMVLSSVIRFGLSTGRFPTFKELKEANFSNIHALGLTEREGMKNRRWTGPSDSAYVTALYTLLRALEREKLITRQKAAGTSKIAAIAPTVNGVLCNALKYPRTIE